MCIRDRYILVWFFPNLWTWWSPSVKLSLLKNTSAKIAEADTGNSVNVNNNIASFIVPNLYSLWNWLTKKWRVIPIEFIFVSILLSNSFTLLSI